MLREKGETLAVKPQLAFAPVEFRRRLGAWYLEHARALPWRGVSDPYATWLSEIMLQQTRVATVIERYVEFLERFPTIEALATAKEADVLALWSGLGYYRRARMLHRGAQFVMRELEGKLPHTSAELRTLPGVGEYTAAAIASIAFGESVAVLDGNVERVLLRVMGEAEDKSARARAGLMGAAQALVPAAAKGARAGGVGNPVPNPPGNHNQAMMELGATLCLPRSPLCLQCPVVELCATRGEHVTPERAKMQSRTVAHLLALRKRGVATEVLLERRAEDASLMAGMLELPALPLDVTQGREPVLRLRHSITNTNYYVRVFSEGGAAAMSGVRGGEAGGKTRRLLRRQVAAGAADLEWVETAKLAQVPLTGLARKVLQRLAVMAVPELKIRRI
jgi:A/G-specific adenine glycosylase